MNTKPKRTPNPVAETTELYRYWAADGSLLYIGISDDTMRRARQHKERSPWFDLVVNVTFERYPTREAALLAEIEAIRAERPIYNIISAGDGARERVLIAQVSQQRAALDALLTFADQRSTILNCTRGRKNPIGPTCRLSALHVKSLVNAAATGREKRHHDGGGLYLKIMASGSASWLLRYRFRNRSRSLGLGSAHRVTLLEARNAARAASDLIQRGVDPIDMKQATKAS